MPEYIERQAAIDAVMAVYVRTAGYKTRERVLETREAIQKLPAADVAPVVHGRWIEKSAPARKIYFECSHCGAQENKHTAIKGYYCWRCGARMDGGDDAKES